MLIRAPRILQEFKFRAYILFPESNKMTSFIAQSFEIVVIQQCPRIVLI